MGRHLIIAGVVQGVGYRAWLHAQARMLHLSGWVRNRSDGSVEAAIFGTPQSVEEIISRAHHGPTSAHVREIQVREIDEDELQVGRFDVLPTE